MFTLNAEAIYSAYVNAGLFITIDQLPSPEDCDSRYMGSFTNLEAFYTWAHKEESSRGVYSYDQSKYTIQEWLEDAFNYAEVEGGIAVFATH